MTRRMGRSKTTIASVKSKFDGKHAEYFEINELAFQLRQFSEPASNEVVGKIIQRKVAAINQILAQSSIECHESTKERPSKMQSFYRNGKVVFRCFHNPHHEFEIDV